MFEGTEDTSLLTDDDVDLDTSDGSENDEPAVDVERVNSFSEKTKTNDTALVVEGERLYVSKHVLGLVSPVFRAMFEIDLDMEEKSVAEIPLPGKYLTDMEEFLLCVYPDRRKSITVVNAAALAPLFEEYQVDDLKNRCEQTLAESCTKYTDVDKIFENLLLAGTFNMKHLKAKCLYLASKEKSSTLKEAQRKCDLPLNLKSELWIHVADRRDSENQSLFSMCRALLNEQCQAKHVKRSSTYGQARPGLTNSNNTHLRAFVNKTTGDEYITAIEHAMYYGPDSISEILIELYAGKLYDMEVESYEELIKSDLPESIKHQILQKIAQQERNKIKI